MFEHLLLSVFRHEAKRAFGDFGVCDRGERREERGERREERGEKRGERGRTLDEKVLTQ